jgi:PAS domain S-box-containing protein
MPRVLYVDDDLVLLDVAKEFLEESGELEIDVANSVEEARISLQRYDYDVIVSDYQMPLTDGIEFLKELRAQGVTLPFILFTGRGREEVVIEALNSGASFYLQKGGDPVAQFAELIHKIRISVERRAAEAALTTANLELEAALAAAQMGTWTLDFSRGTFLVNDRVWSLYGTDSGKEGGYEISVVRFGKEFVHPDDLDRFSREIMSLLEDGSKVRKGSIEFRAFGRDGMARHMNSIYGVYRDDKGHAVAAHGVLQDITERVEDKDRLSRYNRDLVAIKEINRCLVMATTERKLLDDICRISCELAGYRLAWVGMAQQDAAKTVLPVAWYGHDKEYVDQVKASWGSGERSNGPTGMAIRTGKTCIIQDWQGKDDLPWKSAFFAQGFRSSVAIPLKDSAREHSEAFGALMLYATEAEGFTPQEMALLEEMASDLAYGILSLRTRAAGMAAADALRMSEEKYRHIFSAEKSAVFLSDRDANVILEANQAASDLFGYSIDEFKALPASAIAVPRDPAQGDAFRSQNWFPQRVLKRKDGTTFTAEVSVSRFELQGRNMLVASVRDISARLEIEHRLRERNKELEAFYQLAEISQRADIGLSEKLEAIIGMLPGGWQHSEIAGARITLEDFSCMSPLFQDSPWTMRAPIYVNEVEAGCVEVSYTHERPLSDEGPFLREERLLLNSVADEISLLVEKERTRRK